MQVLADSTVVTDDVIIEQGGWESYEIGVRFGDEIHVEWSANQTIQYELSYETEVLEDGSIYSWSSGGPASGDNFTLVSVINGTYTLRLLNDADGPVHIHVVLTVISAESGIDLRWILLGAAIAAVAVVLLALVFGKELQKRKK